MLVTCLIINIFELDDIEKIIFKMLIVLKKSIYLITEKNDTFE